MCLKTSCAGERKLLSFPSKQSIQWTVTCILFYKRYVTSRKRQREVTASQLDNELKSGGSSVSADSDVIKGDIMEMTDEFSRDKRYLLSSERASGKAGIRNPESGIGTGMGRETYIKAGTTFTLI